MMTTLTPVAKSYLPVLYVYILLNIDEIIKLPVVFKHYRQYKWAKNLVKEESANTPYISYKMKNL